jgi:hypothetical protein
MYTHTAAHHLASFAGVPCEHPELKPTLNITDSELDKLQFAAQTAETYLATSLAVENKTCWDCIGGWELNAVDPAAGNTAYGKSQQPPPNTTAGCTAWMRHYCTPGMQGRGMFMAWDVHNPVHHTQVGIVLPQTDAHNLVHHTQVGMVFITNRYV